MTQTAANSPSGPSTSAPMIRFEDIHTAWDERGTDAAGGKALSGLTLTMEPGTITVLLGDHGSGKDLLTSHLLGEIEPTRGRVLVGETSLWELPQSERCALRDSFGLFRGGTSIRESKVVPSRTVRESLCPHLKPDPGAATLDTWLRLLDLTEVVDTVAGDLDPAQRRRLALWLALVDEPAVVVIDNPGEALDCRHFEAMIDIICGWHSKVGATVLISVHSLRVANRLGDAVAVLRGGNLIAHGPPAEVLSGVSDDASFERKFGASLGGYAECDPDRSLRAWKVMTEHDRLVQIAFIVALVAVGAMLIWFFTSGLIPNPFAS